MLWRTTIARLGTILTVCGAAICVSPTALYAGMIMSPTAILANSIGSFSPDFDEAFMIDQSGLSAGFTSGVTDFTTYVGGNPTHNETLSNSIWFGPKFSVTGTLDFDFGAQQNIEQLVLWIAAFTPPSAITVLTSSDAAFAANTVVGLISPANPPDVPGSVAAEVFDITDSSARYLRLLITASLNSSFVGIGEVAIDASEPIPGGGTAIPEPGTLALFGLGLAGLGFARRRKAA